MTEWMTHIVCPCCTSCPPPLSLRWYPPGHGDFYQSFMDSGLLQKLESRGRKYVFVSNIDNMAGTADVNILNKMYRENKEYALEVTNKTRSDVKGTTLVWYDNNYRLVEVAKVPRDRKWQETVKQKSMFNTNNVWVSMSGIRRVVERGFKDMEVNVNSKTLRSGINVLQGGDSIMGSGHRVARWNYNTK